VTTPPTTWWLAAVLALGACRTEGNTHPTPATEAPASEATETLNVGDPAPAFSLADQGGEQVTLAQLTAEGPATQVFYRGHW